MHFTFENIMTATPAPSGQTRSLGKNVNNGECVSTTQTERHLLVPRSFQLQAKSIVNKSLIPSK